MGLFDFLSLFGQSGSDLDADESIQNVVSDIADTKEKYSGTNGPTGHYISITQDIADEYNPWYDSAELIDNTPTYMFDGPYDFKNDDSRSGIMARANAASKKKEAYSNLVNTYSGGETYDYDDEDSIWEAFKADKNLEYDNLQDMLWDINRDDDLITEWYSDPRILAYFLNGDYSDLAGNYDFTDLTGDDLVNMRMDAARALYEAMKERNTWDSISGAFKGMHSNTESSDDLDYLAKFFASQSGLDSFMDIYSKYMANYLSTLVDEENGSSILKKQISDDDIDLIGNQMAAFYEGRSKELNSSPSWNDNWADEDEFFNVLNNAYSDHSNPDSNELYGIYSKGDYDNLKGKNGYYSNESLGSSDNPEFSGYEYYSDYYTDNIEGRSSKEIQDYLEGILSKLSKSSSSGVTQYYGRWT